MGWKPLVRRIAFVIVAVTMLAPIQNASAAEALSPGDPGYDDIASFTIDETSGVGDLTGALVDSATGCHWDWHGIEISAKNAAGVKLVTYGGKVEACVRDGKVRKVRFSTYHHECWCTTWNWVGERIEAQSAQTLPRGYIWRQYRGHFRSCIVWYCKDKWPWVYLGARGDGTFGVNAGLG